MSRACLTVADHDLSQRLLCCRIPAELGLVLVVIVVTVVSDLREATRVQYIDEVLITACLAGCPHGLKHAISHVPMAHELFEVPTGHALGFLLIIASLEVLALAGEAAGHVGLEVHLARRGSGLLTLVVLHQQLL
jgi:hypothetical protein